MKAINFRVQLNNNLTNLEFDIQTTRRWKMARKTRFNPSGVPEHVVHLGNNCQPRHWILVTVIEQIN
jgi:hypothetical protein